MEGWGKERSSKREDESVGNETLVAGVMAYSNGDSVETFNEKVKVDGRAHNHPGDCKAEGKQQQQQQNKGKEELENKTKRQRFESGKIYVRQVRKS